MAYIQPPNPAQPTERMTPTVIADHANPFPLLIGLEPISTAAIIPSSAPSGAVINPQQGMTPIRLNTSAVIARPLVFTRSSFGAGYGAAYGLSNWVMSG